jgi:AcrR family transcriptional regulator
MTESPLLTSRQQRRRRPRQGPATRHLILESSLRLFSDRGYARTSVRDIAQAVGITDAAIYYHFSSKRDLLKAVFEERGIAAALQGLEELDPTDDPTDQLERVCVSAVHILTRNRDFLKVLIVESLAEDNEAVEEWRGAVDRWVLATSRIFRIYQERGVFKNAPAPAAKALVDSILGVYLDALIPGRDYVTSEGEPTERLIEEVALVVRNAICGLQDASS